MSEHPNRHPEIPAPTLQLNNLMDPNNPEAALFTPTERLAAKLAQLADVCLAGSNEAHFRRPDGKRGSLLEPDEFSIETYRAYDGEHTDSINYLIEGTGGPWKQKAVLYLLLEHMPSLDPDAEAGEAVVQHIELSFGINEDYAFSIDSSEPIEDPDMTDKFIKTLDQFEVLLQGFERQ